ncbi:MAG TPA: hypothetical protein VI256_00195, partial [Roseiarcus sp.]
LEGGIKPDIGCQELGVRCAAGRDKAGHSQPHCMNKSAIDLHGFPLMRAKLDQRPEGPQSKGRRLATIILLRLDN